MSIANYTKACSKNVSGNQPSLYVAEVPNVSSVTVATGEVTAIAMLTTTYFRKVECDLDSLKRIFEGTGNRNNVMYTHGVEGRLAKASKEMNTLLDSFADASPCGMIAVMEDSNGTQWLIGYNTVDELARPLFLAQDNFDSGESPEDEEGNNNFFRLETKSGYRQLPLASTFDIATLLEP